MDPAGGKRTGPSLSVLELPQPWLVMLVGALDSASRTTLFQTCKQLRTLVLNSHPVTLTFMLPISEEELHMTNSSLRLAREQSPCITICLDSDGGNAQPLDVERSATRLLDSVIDGKPLKKIIMTELPLIGMVPSWLVDVCTRAPALCNVQHSSCRYYSIPTNNNTNPPTIITTINTLDISDWRGDLDLRTWQQLKALPGLQSLSIMGRRKHAADVVSWCTVIGPQLTQLKIRSCTDEDRVLPTEMPAWYPNLISLRLQSANIVDADVEVLLNLQNLREFECRALRLKHHHCFPTCPWTHLFLSDGVHLSVLARLHTPALQRVQLGDGGSICFSSDAAHNSAPTHVLNNCEGQTVSVLEVQGPGLGRCASAADVAALMPFIGKHPAVTLLVDVDVVTVPLLVAMQQHLGVCTLRNLTLVCEGIASGAAQLLLTSLPSCTRQLNLSSHNHRGSCVTLDEMLSMVAHAVRPIIVNVDDGLQRDWPNRWRQQAKDSMAAHGHQRVRLF